MTLLAKPKKRLSSLFNSTSNGDVTPQETPNSTHNPNNLAPVPPPPTSRPPPPPALNKLRKQSQDRVPSAEHTTPSYPVLPPQQPPVGYGPTITTVDVESLQPPPRIFGESNDGNVSGSSKAGSTYSNNSRPATPNLAVVPEFAAPEQDRKLRRKSWMPGGSKEKAARGRQSDHGPMAWVAGHDQKLPYNLALLLGAEKVPELWNEEGDTLVYLFPRTSGKSPSFRLDASVYSASNVLGRLAHGRIHSSPAISARADSRQVSGSRPDSVHRKAVDPLHTGLRNFSLGGGQVSPTARSPTQERQEFESESTTSSKYSRTGYSEASEIHPTETHLFVPLSLSTDLIQQNSDAPEPKLSSDDIENLISVRNVFAFLVGGPLIATERRPTIFSIFMEISKLLHSWDFTNIDGSTFGEVAEASFAEYVDELNLADVRASREKTVDAIVLGERMRSQGLYVEGYVHGVGKYEEIIKLKVPKFGLISSTTQNRMERASMDLFNREKNINVRLADFDFPAVFSGIMNSKTSSEGKLVRFEAWRKSFMTTKSYVHGYYKHKYGNWPPKASSKKNSLETSGLNRIVLKELYSEMAELYNLLVDRTNLTTRTLAVAEQDESLDNEDQAVARALRLVLSEYDRSSPPVQPAVPFDVPLLPSLTTIGKSATTGDAKRDAKERLKKLKDNEISAILKASHNSDVDTRSPFITAFSELERKAAHGKSIDDIIDLRVGQWLFMYAVLQSLPMLVVDAPGVKWHEGVEYFLCEVPRSGVPWAREDTGVQRSLYRIAGSTGVVSLPADVVEHGVEGIYRRSHCWQMAEEWSKHSGILDAAVQEVMAAPADPTAQQLPPQQHAQAYQQQHHPSHQRNFSVPNSMPPPSVSSRHSSVPSPSLGESSRAPSLGVQIGLPPPPSLDALNPSPGSGRLRSNSPGRRESAMMLGLEALPVPAGMSPAGAPTGSRNGSGAGPVMNTGKTFDDILGGIDDGKDGKKDKKKKK